MNIFSDGSSIILDAEEEFEKAFYGLKTLETVALVAAAANIIPSEGGRPPKLPSDCIQGLARFYRKTTGLKPARGYGPFADFVCQFITAVNQPDFEVKLDSVVDAIKNAHHRHSPSMFDE